MTLQTPPLLSGIVPLVETQLPDRETLFRTLLNTPMREAHIGVGHHANRVVERITSYVSCQGTVSLERCFCWRHGNQGMEQSVTHTGSLRYPHAEKGIVEVSFDNYPEMLQTVFHEIRQRLGEKKHLDERLHRVTEFAQKYVQDTKLVETFVNIILRSDIAGHTVCDKQGWAYRNLLEKELQDLNLEMRGAYSYESGNEIYQPVQYDFDSGDILVIGKHELVGEDEYENRDNCGNVIGIAVWQVKDNTAFFRWFAGGFAGEFQFSPDQIRKLDDLLRRQKHGNGS